MSNRVVITGIGLVTPLGVGARTSWRNLVANKSGLVSTTTLPDYETSRWNEIPSKVIGKVPEGPLAEGKWADTEHFQSSEVGKLALFAKYALSATKEALEDSKWFPQTDEERSWTGVTVGSGTGSIFDTYKNSVAFEQGGYKKIQPLFIPKMLTNMAAGNISIRFGLRGPNHSVSTACATGLHSIGDAYNFIKNGYAQVMVAGGTEAAIHPVALAGFARARSVVTTFNDEPTRASRPFDQDRNGFVLSEGCGIMVIEKLDHALQRGLTSNDIYAEITGYGLSGDANHITAPLEDGDGAFRSMEMCLRNAALAPEQIDYINAHATSTVIGDKSENNAINRLFQNNGKLSISSTKSSIGHLLGAAGAVELIFTAQAVKNDVVPANLNLDNLGTHKQDDHTKYTKFDYVPNNSKEKLVNNALCNSFGFGGTNSTLCLSKYQ